MQYFRAILASLLAFVFASAAVAAAPVLSFTPPVARVDGTPLPASQISGYDVRCSSWTAPGGVAGVCPAGMFSSVSLGAAATGATLSATIPATGGTICFQVATKDTSTPVQVSAWSAEGCKTYAAAPPNPPTNVTIAVVIGLNMAPALALTATGKNSYAVAGYAPLDYVCNGPAVFTYKGKTWRQSADIPVTYWPGVAPANGVAVPCAPST